MTVFIEPLDSKNPRFGPFDSVEYVTVYRTQGITLNPMNVPDIILTFKNRSTSVITLPTNQIYSVNVREEE